MLFQWYTKIIINSSISRCWCTSIHVWVPASSQYTSKEKTQFCWKWPCRWSYICSWFLLWRWTYKAGRYNSNNIRKRNKWISCFRSMVTLANFHKISTEKMVHCILSAVLVNSEFGEIFLSHLLVLLLKWLDLYHKTLPKNVKCDHTLRSQTLVSLISLTTTVVRVRIFIDSKKNLYSVSLSFSIWRLSSCFNSDELSEEENELCRTVMAYWGNFARTG